jgi:outer membrane protein assembly factor BamB
MTITPTNKQTPRKPLRLWPGVVIAIVLVLARYVVPLFAPDDAELFSMPLGILAIFVGMASAMAIVGWWLFFSRAYWSERVGAIILAIVALFATLRLVDKSIAGGMMGVMLFVYSIPVLGLALVVWAVATRRLADGARRVWMVVAILLACVPWTLVRTAGESSDGSEFHWRWTATPEQRLLAQAGDEPKPIPTPPATAEIPKEPIAPTTGDKPVILPEAAKKTELVSPPAAKTRVEAPAIGDRKVARAEWPGFRGPDRDSVVRGVRINTDWSASPPVELWRRPIGPGWSSFAVSGDLLYTQEQRGDDEIVACYRVSTGKPVWMHRDKTRFWESNAGAGPRGTPTLSNGRVYAFGATGILNALDAGGGAVVWSRNVASDTNRAVPDWGFASSPLVIDDVVIVAASGTLAAYDVATGKTRWIGPQHGGSYSSPHRATIDGVEQVLLLSPPGVISVAAASGALLWEHTWEGGAIVQPALTADGDVLINAMSAMGGIATRRLAVRRGSAGWSVEERWTSRGLKPYFNDFVVHKGHAFGFDGSILACIDVVDGNRKWKGGRYGQGQLVLLPDQDVLLVVSEEGELALVKATPEQFTQIARVPAIEGKTWNHPVLVGDVLLVRNGEEMAAFRLSLLGP